MERIAYDEFAYFHENAQEFGIEWHGPPQVRRHTSTLTDGRRISSLVWGDGEPRYVFLHGGAQNAHTWDTVALALDVPLVCIDLPGHGHSDGMALRHAQGVSPVDNANDVAPVIAELAPQAVAVIGMSLGGMTTIALAHRHPELVRSAVLVDVTPGVDSHKSRFITSFINGPETFPAFEEILARTVEHNPGRSEASLRRGILHNAVQEPDGTWRWRYRRDRRPESIGNGNTHVDFSYLWDELSTITVPLMLVRGMQEQGVVDDADEAELLRRVPGARIEHVADAGHSVQGDTPVLLADLIRSFAP
jgi:pimeloyl-ACP methyl ester carboxylesterase